MLALIFVVAGACDDSSTGSSGGGSSVANGGSGAGSGSMTGAGNGTSSAAGGAGQSTMAAEGGPCTMNRSVCDPSCQASCGSVSCVDLCCKDQPVTGFMCGGVCQETCTFHDQGAPECVAAQPVKGSDGSCTIKATVKGRAYEIHASGLHQLPTGQFPDWVCKRSEKSLGSAGGSQCGTSGCCKNSSCSDVCEALAADWAQCCGS